MSYSLAQYDSFLSIYICLLATVPCVILGLLGKRSKIVNLVISVAMVTSILGLQTIQMLQLFLFLAWELILIFFFYCFRKKCASDLIYYIVFALSLLPIFIVRIAGAAHLFDSYSGFVGLSYISFKIWQILMEIHDGGIQKLSFLDVLSDFLFFPSYSSGPIIRYREFQEECCKPIERSIYLAEYLIPGGKKIILGLFYKFSVAFFINTYFLEKLPEGTAIGTVILYAYGYTLYLFFDFAGYSMIAIGYGALMGIKLPENFNKPFLARNMKEFWGRWHMSLSNWFNDYVFGRFVLNNIRNGLFKNTKSAARWAYMFSMTTMGLWHGFSLHYLVYGLYEGALLVVTDIYVRSKLYRKIKKKKWFDWVSRVVCFQFIALGMLIFSGHFWTK